MTFKYRRSRQWQTPTIKQRKNGQWVTINGSNDGGDRGSVSSRFYMDGPPIRSGDTITYDGTNYSSLQAAYNDLTEGDTLYIDPSNSPYSGRIRMEDNPTDHITITSDQQLAFNLGNGYTIKREGAEIQQPDTNYESIIKTGSDPSYTADAELVGPHSGGGAEGDGNTSDVGDIEISVTDASPFVGYEGEVIFINEKRVPYGEPSASGGSGHPDITHEFKILDTIDTNNNILTLHQPLYLPYPNNNPTSVGIVDDFACRDIHISGLTLRADKTHSSSRPLKIYGAFEPWIDNMRLLEAGGNHTVIQTGTFRARYDRVAIENSNRYAININKASTDSYLTDIYGKGHNRYVTRFGAAGSGSRNSVGGLVDGIEGANLSHNPVCMAHWGGFYNIFTNVYANPKSKVIRFRSRHLTVDNFTLNGVKKTELDHTQRPFSCVAKNGTSINRDNIDNEIVFWFELDNLNSTYGNDYAEDLLYENIDIEQYGSYGPEDIGSFGENAEINGLTFRNITYGGQQLQRSHVEQWTNYDPTRITNLIIE